MAAFQAEYDAKFEVPEKHGEAAFNDLLGGLSYIISVFSIKANKRNCKTVASLQLLQFLRRTQLMKKPSH